MRFITLKNQRGFTFIEAIIAFSIIGVFLLITWSTVQFLLNKSTEQIKRTRAHFLAIEGVELVKQIRQTAVNRNRRNGFFRSIGDKTGSYILLKNGFEYTLTLGTDERIEVIEEPYTEYCRTVEVSGSETDAKQVLVRVKWGDPDCTTGNSEVAYSSYLGDTAQ